MSERNPEVMGRTEPRTVMAPEPVANPPVDTQTDTGSEMGRTEPRVMAPQPVANPQVDTQTDTVSEMSEIRRRFDELQSEFIERPQDAVHKAERLTEEAIDQMTKVMREQISDIHREIEGNSDTERLRLAMRSYRMLIDSIGRRQAA